MSTKRIPKEGEVWTTLGHQPITMLRTRDDGAWLVGYPNGERWWWSLGHIQGRCTPPARVLADCERWWNVYDDGSIGPNRIAVLHFGIRDGQPFAEVEEVDE